MESVHHWSLLVHSDTPLKIHRWSLLVHSDTPLKIHRWSLLVHSDTPLKIRRWSLPVHSQAMKFNARTIYLSDGYLDWKNGQAELDQTTGIRERIAPICCSVHLLSHGCVFFICLRNFTEFILNIESGLAKVGGFPNPWVCIALCTCKRCATGATAGPLLRGWYIFYLYLPLIFWKKT